MHVQPPRHGWLCLPGHHPANTAVTDLHIGEWGFLSLNSTQPPSRQPRGDALGQGDSGMLLPLCGVSLYMAAVLALVKEEISPGFLKRMKPSEAILHGETFSHAPPGRRDLGAGAGSGVGAASAALQGSGSSGGKGQLPAPELRAGTRRCPSYPPARYPCPHTTTTTTNSRRHKTQP